MVRPRKSMVLLKTVKKTQPHGLVEIRYLKMNLLHTILYKISRYNLITWRTLTHRQTFVRTSCQDQHLLAVRTWLIPTPSSMPVWRTCATVTAVPHVCVQPYRSTPVSALMQVGIRSNGRPHNCVVRTAIFIFIYSSFDWFILFMSESLFLNCTFFSGVLNSKNMPFQHGV